MKTGTLEPVSNLETWTDTIEFYDDDDGTAFDLEDVTEVTLRLRDPSNGAIVLEGTLTGGDLTVVGDEADGTVEFVFSADAMSALNPKTYEIGCLLETATITKQIILGRMPVLEGL